MPLGEMLDLEKLAQTCREKNRWFFFFTSAPANCPGTLNTWMIKPLQSLTASQAESAHTSTALPSSEQFKNVQIPR